MTTEKAFALGAGGVLGGLGLWAFAAPSSFYEFATYPPFNPHFIRDVGAFMIGLAGVLLVAAVASDALLAAFAGNGAGALFHGVSHLIDRTLGGGSWRDPILAFGFAAMLIVAAVSRWRKRRPRIEPSR